MSLFRTALALLLGLYVAALTPTVSAAQSPATVTIGSKTFTESVILGEILRQLARSAGYTAVYKRQLGGTRVLWDALRAGDIDAYPEYTGTLLHEILAKEHLHGEKELRQALARRGLRMTGTLGFNDTYAMGMQAAVADRLHIRNISDLRKHPQLVFGFSNEFMDRADGWPGLRRRYRLPQHHVRGLDHNLAYRGLASGKLQVTDVYTTDAEIPYYHLRMLRDDLHFFPKYEAVILYRADLARRAPKVAALFRQLAGHIDANTMRAMNSRVKLGHEPESRVASDFLARHLHVDTTVRVQTAWHRFLQRTGEHLVLVGISLFAAIVVAIPLGILAARRPHAGHFILGTAGILQTIPSLALFVFMIPLLGIGGLPAIVALFLYSLLPIIRNTHAGLKDIPPAIVESAQALGLPPSARLRTVELPLATRAILAGIKTSAVINVGTATLGALIGAGGYGQPILTGIRLDNISLILQGAVPAAAMALLAQGLFSAIERAMLPRGLRIRPAQ